MLSIDEMQSHVEFLAQKHLIIVDSLDNASNYTDQKIALDEEGYGGVSLPATRRIFVIPIWDEVSYFAQLHEIGHIVAEDEKQFLKIETQAMNLGMKAMLAHNEDDFKLSYEIHRKNMLDMEIAATTWAAKNALKFTPAMQRAAKRFYFTYTRGFGEAVTKG